MKSHTDFKNSLLKRREVLFGIDAASNPGFATAIKSVVEKFKADEQNVVVKSVRNNFGSNHFVIEAFIYDSVADKEKIEPKLKTKNSTPKKEAKKE